MSYKSRRVKVKPNFQKAWNEAATGRQFLSDRCIQELALKDEREMYTARSFEMQSTFYSTPTEGVFIGNYHPFTAENLRETKKWVIFSLITKKSRVVTDEFINQVDHRFIKQIIDEMC